MINPPFVVSWVNLPLKKVAKNENVCSAQTSTHPVLQPLLAFKYCIITSWPHSFRKKPNRDQAMNVWQICLNRTLIASQTPKYKRKTCGPNGLLILQPLGHFSKQLYIFVCYVRLCYCAEAEDVFLLGGHFECYLTMQHLSMSKKQSCTLAGAQNDAIFTSKTHLPQPVESHAYFPIEHMAGA